MATVLLALAIGIYWQLGETPGFFGHMAVHIVNIGIAAPLGSYALARSWPPPVRRTRPWIGLLMNAPVVAASVELVVVWAWHLPALNRWAQASETVFLLEQASIFAVGLLIWAPSFAAYHRGDKARLGAGILALLFTSMHMTLLGALLLFAGRPIYSALPVGTESFCGLSPRADQIVGGTVMVALLGLIYLLAALVFCRELLSDRRSSPLGVREA